LSRSISQTTQGEDRCTRSLRGGARRRPLGGVERRRERSGGSPHGRRHQARADHPLLGKPLAAAPYALQAGKYYSIEINADGSAELAIGGQQFFRNVWVDEVVINDIEVRPLGVDSIEFDDEGTARISFVTIRPGTFELRIPGTTAESQRAVFVVK
jgi:hypothetical protein